MVSITIDTYSLISGLKSRGFSEEQARGVSDAIQQIDMSNLATKGDLHLEISTLRAELSDFRAELFKWLIPLLMGQAGLIAALVKLL